MWLRIYPRGIYHSHACSWCDRRCYCSALLRSRHTADRGVCTNTRDTAHASQQTISYRRCISTEYDYSKPSPLPKARLFSFPRLVPAFEGVLTPTITYAPWMFDRHRQDACTVGIMALLQQVVTFCRSFQMTHVTMCFKFRTATKNRSSPHHLFT